MSAFNRRSTAEQVTEGLDLSGKTILITGVNSGLGYESMRVLAMRGAHIIGCARTIEKAREACESVDGQTTAVACELSDPASVNQCADTIIAMQTPIDVLLCNAGIMALMDHQQAHGLEMQFLTNHIGHFLLIQRLLGCLQEAGKSRVVLTSSGGHTHTVAGGIDFANLSGDKYYDAWKFYGQSKLANILCANEIARRYKDHGITANAVHPGVIQTNLARNAGGLMTKVIQLFAPLFSRSIAQGAASQCYLAVNPDCESVSGEYFADCNPTKPSKYALDKDLANQLWERSEKIIAEFND